MLLGVYDTVYNQFQSQLFSMWEVEMCLTSFINLSHSDEKLWHKMGGASANTPCLVGHFLPFSPGWSLSLPHLWDCATYLQQFMWIFMDITTHLALLTSNLLYTLNYSSKVYLVKAWVKFSEELMQFFRTVVSRNCRFSSCAWWHCKYTCRHMAFHVIEEEMQIK